MTHHAYLPAIEIRPGDRLPEASQSAVYAVKRFGVDIVVTFIGNDPARFYRYYGPDVGWDHVNIERG